MATTDINGMVFYETTDPVTPLQNVLNGISTAVTNAFDSTDRVFEVANAIARDALYASRGAPLTVARADTGVWERNRSGVGWGPVDGEVRGTATITSPTTSVQSTSIISFGVTYAAAPTVLTSQVVSSAGVIVHTYAISVSTTEFVIRYVASGTFGSSPLVAWSAKGVLA